MDAQLKVIKEGPPIKPTADGLQDLYIGLLSCRKLLRSAGVTEKLDAPATTEGIFQLLPLMLQRRFVRFAIDYGYEIKRISYKEVMTFIKICRDEANSNFGRLLESGVPETQVSRQRVVQRGRTKLGRASAVHVTPDKIQDDSKLVEFEKVHECSCCGSRVLHGLWKCPKFISLHVDERRALVKRGKYCFCCLKTGRLAKECTGKFQCRQCGLSHNSLLHTAKRVQDIRKEETKGNTMITNATAVCKSEIDSSEGKDGGECKGPSRLRTRLKVLPVEVVNEQSGYARKVLAFLDGGADCNLIRRDFYDKLGLKGDPVKSKIGLADGTSAVEETYVTHLLVRGLGDAAAAGTYELTSVIVREELADVGTSAPTPEDFERNAHLMDVEIPFLDKDKIDLIIGLNARILHEIHDKREAGSDQLCAGRCVLGLLLFGNDATVDHMEESDWTISACFVTSPFVAPKYESPFSKSNLCPICLESGKYLDCKGSRSGKLDVDHREPSLNDDRAQSILDETCRLLL